MFQAPTFAPAERWLAVNEFAARERQLPTAGARCRARETTAGKVRRWSVANWRRLGHHRYWRWTDSLPTDWPALSNSFRKTCAGRRNSCRWVPRPRGKAGARPWLGAASRCTRRAPPCSHCRRMPLPALPRTRFRRTPLRGERRCSALRRCNRRPNARTQILPSIPALRWPRARLTVVEASLHSTRGRASSDTNDCPMPSRRRGLRRPAPWGPRHTRRGACR